MRKQLFVLLFVLILCQANIKTENHNHKAKLRGKNIGNPLEKIGQANYIDKDINALLLLQQQVRQANFHKNRHQAISQIKQIIDTNLNTNKIQDSKYHDWQSQTKEKLKFHINMLENAETEEESKDCCDMLDDLVQSLIISGNLVNQPAPQQPQPIIVIVEDTTPDKPDQEQTKTIDIDQNDEIQHLDQGPDQLGDQEPSESDGSDSETERSNRKKQRKGTQKKKGIKKYRKIVGEDGEEEEESYYSEEEELEQDSSSETGDSESDKGLNVDQDQDEDEGGVAKTSAPPQRKDKESHSNEIDSKDVKKHQADDDDDSYDSSYGEDDEDDDEEGRKKRKRRSFEESSKRKKSNSKNENERNEGGYYYSGEGRRDEGDGTLESGTSYEKPVYQKTLTIEEEATQDKNAASSEEEEEIEETTTKITGTDESIDENEEFDDSKVVVEKSSTSTKSKKSSKSSKEKAVKEPASFSEYGYGFWFRFLSKYPEILEEGATEPLYFISKLSIIEEDDEQDKDQKLGDKALLVHLGQESYEFVTCNQEDDNPNVSQNIDHPDDIEGVWSYLYYSYSQNEKQAVAFLKIGDDEFKRIQHDVVHPKSKYIRLTVGGSDNKRLPGFNGLFLRITVTQNDGAFIETEDKLLEFFKKQGPIPTSSLLTLKSKEIQEDLVKTEPDDDVKYIKVTEKKFATEYAISGWFRFKLPENQEEWHNGFRVEIKQPSTDTQLGDRVFQYQIERDDGGKIWSTTYTYLNIKGDGKFSLPQSALHSDRHLKWHFVYQSYSKATKKAIFYIKFSEDDETFNWEDINHYFSSQFYIYLGATQHQPGWSGDIAYVQFVLGPKAQVDDGDFTNPKDLFKFKLGSQELKDDVKEDKNKDQEDNQDDKKDNDNDDDNDKDNNKVSKDNQDKPKEKGKDKQGKKDKQKHHHKSESDSESSSDSESEDDGDNENDRKPKKEKAQVKDRSKEKQNDKDRDNQNDQQKDGHKNKDDNDDKLKKDKSKKDDEDDDDHKDKNIQDKKEQHKDQDKHGDQDKNKDKNKDQDNQQNRPKDKEDDASHKQKDDNKDNSKKDADDNDDDDDNYLSNQEKGRQDNQKDGDRKDKRDKDDIYDSDTNQKNTIFDKEKSDNKFFDTYGYGFWFRYLSTYPSRMVSGKNAPWYFISRLTSNNPYDNIRMNDRILAIWQGDGYYHFTTCNIDTGNVNQVINNNYPTDIEGLWTYLYYSYSANEKEAVALIKYGQQEIQVISHKTGHQKTKYLRFILGGNDQGRYPGFNGQFTQVYYSTYNAFKKNAGQLNEHINKNNVPSPFTKSTLNINLIDEVVIRKIDDPTSKFQTVGGGQNKFPSEYAFSGWFRWDKTVQQAWHNLFRVTIKNPSTDAFLGDRTLTCWLGIESGGILHFPTYTYVNMVGGGNTNLYQNVQHENRHLDWFFVYFGYSKKQQQAFVFVRWIETQNQLVYEKVNHYLVPEFYVYVGKDNHFPGFNGGIAYVSFNLGEGVFRKSDYDQHEKDAFQYKLGLSKLFKENLGSEEKSDQQLESSFNQKSPSFEKVINSEGWITEYGYGFWLRFLTAYPQRLISGKNEAWYFVSRLTSMDPYDNIRMNDRRLAIWQGAGFYHFTTCNQQTGNVNQVINNNFPEDIEGVWTYVYYSYSEKAKKAIGLIKYGKGEFNIVNHDTIHEKTKYIKFILGGNDQNRYPGFNGIFSDVTFSSRPGSFLSSPESLSKYNQLPQEDVRELFSTVLIEEIVQRKTDDPIQKQQTVGGGQNKFPSEYAFSGWFRWDKTIQHAWHNLFRVTIKNPSTDAFLGDRTLTCWLGLEQGGILHFPTYTYVNMVGGGNTNLYQNIKHDNRHLDWFFVYFGYSKKQQQSFVFVRWIDQLNQLVYEKVNHYLVPEFYVYVGRDAHFPGFNGALAYISFNLGEGAFRKSDYDQHQKDAFLYKLGLSKLFKENLGSEEKSDQQLESSFNQKQPTFEKVITSDGWITEYGYGFWLRFLTTYPQRLLAGKNEAWYFLSRLTSMDPYDNIRMNDRRLAIWQGMGFYHFTTCNQQTGNVNQVLNNNFPEDIEGLWTYVYYSYSEKAKKAIGLIKYGKGDFNIINHDTIHEKTKYVKFILGGNDQNRYPGFNGIFKSVTFSSKAGSFIGSPDQIKFDNQIPVAEVTELFTTKLIDNQLSRSTDDQPFYQVVGQEESYFSHEYAIAGWYRWQPTAQQAWHNFFRVSIKQQSTDVYLGDRTLTMWLGLGFLHFPTYTYVNMVGGGNTNHHQNINHRDRHLQWFYVYFGYSKKVKQCYIYVKWTDSDDTLTYENINHYFVDEFYVFIGKDKFYPGLNGKLAYVNFNIGQGAFTKDFNHKDDAFAYQLGLQNLFAKKSDFNPNIIQSQILKNAHNQDLPVLDNEQKSDTDFEEYGYGFWLRFLTVYPVRLLAGKNEAWYFVARLTLNNPYDNIRVGDRLLAIWQGQGYYHFTTCNRVDNNPNYVQNINFPQDIEGIWTYIYYSYSADQNKAIAFIKYGEGELQSVTHKVTHPKTRYLRFILGGNDQKRYPGFNGQFYNIAFTLKSGAFVEQSTQLAGYLSKSKAPLLNSPLQTEILISEKQSRTFTQDFIQKTFSQPDPPTFSREYSISGWFKWQQMAQQPWHNIFRVQIKQPATDAFLGDRTLCLWLGLGFLHLPTYTYDNMNGGGNTNWWQNIDHRERHTQWFYVYYGYSKIKEKAYVYVKWTNDDSSLSYERAKHYYSHQYFIYVGKDPFYPGLNGQITQVRWNQGDGAFRENKDFTHENDIFGFASLKVQGVGKFDINDIQRDAIPSFQENKKGALLKSWDDLNGVKEYGYGFWLRFLSRYPTPLNRGLQHPWSIVARLSKNSDYQDIRVGDRTLSLWLGQGFYHFTTYDGGNPNANQNINHPADIEGLWTFIHYSHSLEKKKSVAFTKFGNEQFQKRDIPATHTSPSILKFYLGMNDNIYVAFNGQFQNVYVSLGEGVYQETEEALMNNIFKQIKKPDNENQELKVRELIPKTKQFTPEIANQEDVYEDGQLVAEYSWSGWFKWNPTDQREWHLIVRLSDLQNSENIAFLGDRTLSAWVGRSAGGIIHLSTYTYHDIRGNGNPDLWKQIQYQQDLTKWHYIYFGYSRLQRQAYAVVQFPNRAPNHEWKEVNHYLPGKLSLYIAKDKWHSTYSGNIGYLRLNTGPESFTKEYQKQAQDIFGYSLGKQELNVGSFIQIEEPAIDQDCDSKEQGEVIANQSFLSYNNRVRE